MHLKVLSPLRHSGEHYKPGDVVEMDGEQAAILIADCIAEKTDKPKTVKEPLKPSETDKPKTVKEPLKPSETDKAKAVKEPVKPSETDEPKTAEQPSSDGAASSGNDQAPEDEEQNSGEDDAASAE